MSLVRAIKIMLQCDGYVVKSHEREQTSIDNIVDLLSPLSPADVVSAVKYLTAIYLPMVLHDEMPPRPDFLSPEATLFTGEYGRYIKRLFVTSVGQTRPSRRSLSLACTILQLKRYLPPLPRILQLQAVRDCKKRLMKTEVTERSILDHINLVTKELFPLGWDNGGIPKYTVTNKSCHESSRGAGGAQGFMFDPLNSIHAPWKPLKKKSTLQLIQETIEIMDGTRKKKNTETKTAPIITVPYSYEEYDLTRMDSNSVTLRQHPLAIRPIDYFEEALRTAPDQLQARMEIVEDPLKARVITKNNWQCTILKPLQKMIHGRMRQDSRFELMGKQIDSDVINAIPLFPGAKWVSGDYAAATDNLHADVTETCLEAILSSMTGRFSRIPEFQSLALRSLTNLEIFHPEVGSFIQTNGQLMGSLLSFPILCIANYAMWDLTYTKFYGKRPTGLGMNGAPDRVRINGDDIAFASVPEMYELWKNLVVQIGLEPSMGKNYFSNQMVMLNSRPFIWDEESRQMVNLKWLNLGLLKSPADEEADNIESLGSMHDEFVSCAGDPRFASGIFITEQRGMLCTTFRNLFGPREFGGLGAHPVRGTRGMDAEAYDVRQLYVAKLLKEGLINLPSSGATRNYSQYIERYVKLKFPNVVTGSLDNLPDPAPGFRWEDVTERVDACRMDAESTTAWLGPLLVTRRTRKDHAFLRSLMRTVRAKKIEGLPWETYMTFPVDTALYCLAVENLENLSFQAGEEVVVVTDEQLQGSPQHENEECVTDDDMDVAESH